MEFDTGYSMLLGVDKVHQVSVYALCATFLHGTRIHILK